MVTKIVDNKKFCGNQKRLQSKSPNYGYWKPVLLPHGVWRLKQVRFWSPLPLPQVAQYGLWSRLTLFWHDIGLHLCPNKHVTSWQMPKHYDNHGWIMLKKFERETTIWYKNTHVLMNFLLFHYLNNPISFWKIVVKKCNDSNLVYKRSR